MMNEYKVLLMRDPTADGHGNIMFIKEMDSAWVIWIRNNRAFNRLY